jgi:hypothetical protein
MVIECISWNDTEMLLNPEHVEYCYLVKKDGYGEHIDHIMIKTISGAQFELRDGKAIYEKLRKL